MSGFRKRFLILLVFSGSLLLLKRHQDPEPNHGQGDERDNLEEARQLPSPESGDYARIRHQASGFENNQRNSKGDNKGDHVEAPRPEKEHHSIEDDNNVDHLEVPRPVNEQQNIEDDNNIDHFEVPRPENEQQNIEDDNNVDHFETPQSDKEQQNIEYDNNVVHFEVPRAENEQLNIKDDNNVDNFEAPQPKNEQQNTKDHNNVVHFEARHPKTERQNIKDRNKRGNFETSKPDENEQQNNEGHKNDDHWETDERVSRKQSINQVNEAFKDDIINVNFEHTEHKNEGSTKTIIWYDIYHNGHGVRNHAQNMKFSACEYSNCSIKYEIIQRKTTRETPLNGDAVLFQLNRLSSGMLPPPKRDVDQVFVVVEREATPMGRDRWLNQINWTMTYRRDSDIPYTYSSIHRLKNGTAGPTKDYDEIFNEKSKTAAWLVSHCRTKSKREDYVKELQAVTDVDILGECGRTDVCPKHQGSCFQELSRQYKFYMAFENTFHTDYVTEKFFDWYQRDVITVVRGGADYSKFARPDTYINARDFASPAELGRFLNKLGQDKDRYINYLKRKDQFYVLSKQAQIQNGYCTLCKWLHTLESHRKYYPNIGKWWLEGYSNFKKDKTEDWRAL